jgi:hypothetical protein
MLSARPKGTIEADRRTTRVEARVNYRAPLATIFANVEDPNYEKLRDLPDHVHKNPLA